MSEKFDVGVIGAGPGGYVAALKAAQLGAKTALIEEAKDLGGTCLNYGCIPSKSLLASAELMHKFGRAREYGLKLSGEVAVDWTRIQRRKDSVLRRLRAGVGNLLAARGVAVFKARARLDGPGRAILEGEGGGEVLADKFILAVGSAPARPAGWPDSPETICTSDEALHWADLPESLLIVGGGVIGCEFACMMREFGVETTVVEMMPRILPEMDEDLGEALMAVLAKRKIKFYVDTKVDSLETGADGCVATLSNGEAVRSSRVLVAIGRRPNTERLGLETVGIEPDRGFVRVNDRMETSASGIYCIGDANGRCLLAHAASAQGVLAARNACGETLDFDSPIPSAVYTFPEIGSVGLTLRQAEERGIPVETGKFPLGYLGKAMAVGEADGFCKVLRHRESGELLGAHIFGHNATESISAATSLLHTKASVEDMADVVFAHPSMSEAMKEAAEDAFGKALHLPPEAVAK